MSVHVIVPQCTDSCWYSLGRFFFTKPIKCLSNVYNCMKLLHAVDNSGDLQLLTDDTIALYINKIISYTVHVPKHVLVWEAWTAFKLDPHLRRFGLIAWMKWQMSGATHSVMVIPMDRITVKKKNHIPIYCFETPFKRPIKKTLRSI